MYPKTFRSNVKNTKINRIWLFDQWSFHEKVNNLTISFFIHSTVSSNIETRYNDKKISLNSSHSHSTCNSTCVNGSVHGRFHSARRHEIIERILAVTHRLRSYVFSFFKSSCRGGAHFNSIRCTRRDCDDFFARLINSTVVPDRAASEGGGGEYQGRACDHHSEFIMADTILSVIHEDEEEEEDLEAMKFLA